MAEDNPTTVLRQPLSLLMVLWGVTPGIILAIAGFYLDLEHMPPESPEFPATELNIVLLFMVLIQLSWSYWLSRDWGLRFFKRFWAVIALTFFGVWANHFFAIAGCGVFYFTWGAVR